MLDYYYQGLVGYTVNCSLFMVVFIASCCNCEGMCWYGLVMTEVFRISITCLLLFQANSALFPQYICHRPISFYSKITIYEVSSSQYNYYSSIHRYYKSWSFVFFSEVAVFKVHYKMALQTVAKLWRLLVMSGELWTFGPGIVLGLVVWGADFGKVRVQKISIVISGFWGIEWCYFFVIISVFIIFHGVWIGSHIIMNGNYGYSCRFIPTFSCFHYGSPFLSL